MDSSGRVDEMVASVRRALVDAASEARTITYGELAARVADPPLPARSPLLMRVLGEACDELDSQRNVVHAALVVRADSGIPGDGFFSWLERSGVAIEDRERLWREVVERVWASYDPGSDGG